MADFELNVRVNGVEQTVNTIGGLEQALADTNAQLQKVDQNSKEFSFLTNQAKNLEKVIGALSTDAAEFNSELKTVNATTQQLNQSFTTTAQVATEGLQTATSNSASLRQELRQITLELQNLEPGSAEFQRLSNRAGELRDTIGDTNAVINATAGNVTERFGRALTASLNIGLAGFQALTAAQAIFGSDNEALNETLVKLTALLNLSQAIETFGGLGDKITEITAGFGLFSGAATTAAGALGVETAATDAATVATTGLGLSMKALPIFAIISAVAALGIGLYSYINSSKNAAKIEEERKKKQEELAKATKEQAQFVAKESSELLLLLFQLKSTNEGSKERIRLIKEINKDYGATLKNYSDEAKFLEQVNGAIQDYVAIQQVKFKLQKNEEFYQQQLEKAYTAEINLNKLRTQTAKNFALTEDQRKAALGDKQAEARFLTELGKKYQDINLERTFEFQQYAKIRDEVKKLTEQYNASQTALIKLSERRNQLIKDETETSKEYFKNLDKGNKTVETNNKLTKDQTALAQFNNDLKKDAIALQDQERTNSIKKTTSVVDDLQFEQSVALRNLDDRYKEAIKTDKAEVKEKKKTKSEKEQIDKAYFEAVTKLNEEYRVRIARQGQIELSDQNALNDELLLQNKILQEEILFGDQNTADQRATIQQRSLALSLKEVEQRIANERLSLQDFQKLLEEKLRLQGEYTTIQLGIDTKVAKATAERDLQNFIKLEAQLLNAKILENKKKEGEDDASFQRRLETEGKYIIERETGEKVTREKFTKEEEQAYQNIILQKKNLDENYAKTVEELTTQYVETNSKAITDGDKQTNQIRLDLLNEFFSTAETALQSFGDTQVAGFSSIVSASLTGIQDYFKLIDQDFANTSDKVAAYATAIAGALNTIISGFVAANQAQLQQELTDLEIQNNAKKDLYTEDYNTQVELQKQKVADGLITEEEYNKAIESLNTTYNDNTKNADKALSKEQRKLKEKAFKEDKGLKIAQTIITGLQGAVQAFAGAMQLGPIAGPIVGGVLAAAVLGLSSANVAKISKTQYNGGQSVDQSDTSLTSASQASVAAPAIASTGGFTSFTPAATGATIPNAGGSFTPMTSSATKVYVLESDITATQNKVRVLENNSTFG